MNADTFENNVENILSMSDEEAKQNEAQGNYISVLKNTPDVILENVKGAEDLEIIIRFDALYLATRKEGVVKGHYHNLGGEIANLLPKLISDPEVIVRLENGRLNLLSTVGTNNIVSIELNTVKNVNSK